MAPTRNRMAGLNRHVGSNPTSSAKYVRLEFLNKIMNKNYVVGILSFVIGLYLVFYSYHSYKNGVVLLGNGRYGFMIRKEKRTVYKNQNPVGFYLIIILQFLMGVGFLIFGPYIIIH